MSGVSRLGSVALLDVNVLLALFFPDHVDHLVAHDWFGDHAPHEWATCPLTENGFLRVAAQQPFESGAPMRPADIATHFRKFRASRGHHFWPDAVSLNDDTLFRVEFMRGHRQVTDIYLLGLAKKMGGRLATFDRTIPVEAVMGAKAADLEIISA